MEPHSPKRWRYVIAVAIVAMLSAIAIPVARSVLRSNRIESQVRSMRDIGQGLYWFDQAYERFPHSAAVDAVGRPLYSWRVPLISFLEARMRHWGFEQAWDDPENQWLTCSKDYDFCWSPQQEGPEAWYTSVVAITGPGTAFEAMQTRKHEVPPPGAILAIEMADSQIIWTEPGDLDIEEVPTSIIRGIYGDGVCVLFADGRVWFLRTDVPFEDLRKFFTVQGAEQYDREGLLGPYVIGGR